MKATLIPGIAFMGPENAVYATPMMVSDEVEECGGGVHVRFVVEVDKTRQRLAKKRAAAQKP